MWSETSIPWNFISRFTIPFFSRRNKNKFHSLSDNNFCCCMAHRKNAKREIDSTLLWQRERANSRTKAFHVKFAPFFRSNASFCLFVMRKHFKIFFCAISNWVWEAAEKWVIEALHRDNCEQNVRSIEKGFVVTMEAVLALTVKGFFRASWSFFQWSGKAHKSY